MIVAHLPIALALLGWPADVAVSPSKGDRPLSFQKSLAGLDRPDAGAVRHHAGARVALLRQQPEFPPGRTLFAEAKTALDELLAAHDDMIHTAEALALLRNISPEELANLTTANFHRLFPTTT